jgi:Flp pilus assembly protein TadD
MVYMETMATYLENRWAPLHGLRRHGDKYIFAPTPEYYDLKTDPDELTNLLEGTSREEVKVAVAALSAELAARMEDNPTAEAVAAAAVEVDPEALRRLQSLGYLTGEASHDTDELPDPKLMMPTWELLGKAKELRIAGHHEQALATIEQVLEGSPNDPAALRELGTVYLDLNRFEEAEQALRKYIDIKPNVSVYQFLGQLATRAKRYDEAEAFLQKALSLDPQHGRTLISLGYLEDVHGRQDEALRYYELAKRVDPVRATAAADKHIADVRKRSNTP